MPASPRTNSAEPRLTPEQACLLQLAAMGLLEPPRKVAAKADLLRCIRRMNVLQIDTIHIVARSPYPQDG